MLLHPVSLMLGVFAISLNAYANRITIPVPAPVWLVSLPKLLRGQFSHVLNARRQLLASRKLRLSATDSTPSPVSIR
jgi:hypothetical protein